MTTKCCCLLCHSEIAINMLNRHYNTKQCQSGSKFSFKKLEKCPYCNILPDQASNFANHVRWCQQNPKHEEYVKAASERSKQTLSGIQSKESIEKRRIGIKNAHKNGSCDNAPQKSLESKMRNGTLKHTEEGRENCKAAALNSKHQRKMRNSHTFVDKNGRQFTFDSSWEDALAIRLDSLGVNWTRPEPIRYELEGKFRNYFPDFYLPDHDLYIDPKNEYCQRLQKPKLDIVSKMINLLIIGSLEECKKFNI